MDMFKILNFLCSCLISAIPETLNFIFEIRKTLLNRSGQRREIPVLITRYIMKLIFKAILVFKQ